MVGVVWDITEQKTNEAELVKAKEKAEELTQGLKYSSERLTALVESMPDAIFFKNGKGQLLITNEAAKKLFKLHEIDWIGKDEKELADLHPHFRLAHEACEIDDEKAWQVGKLTLFTEFPIDEWGRTRVYDVRKMPIFNTDGSRKALVIIGRDITERKAAEEQIIQSEKRMHEAQAIAKIGSWQFDLQTFELTWSREHYRIFELDETPADKLYDVYRSKIHPDDIAELDRLVNRAIEGGFGFIYEHRVVCKDGSIKNVLSVGQTVKGANGKAMAVNGTLQDITEQKKAVKKLADERLLLRTIINNLPMNVYAKNLSRQKILANQIVDEYMGASSEQEVVGKDDLALFFKDSEAISLEEDRQVFAGNSILGKETLNLRKDGSQTWFLISKVPLKNTEGKITGVVGVSVDITERKQQEEALLASNREKDLLIKEIHHRIKNNLQLISSVIFIRMSKMPVSKTRDFLDETRQKIKAIALIHENLLQTESLNKINISVYLNRLLTDLQIAYSTQEANITVAVNIESILVTTDVAINCSLIVNELFTNSMKHAFKDRQGGLISVSIQKQEDKLEFVMSDDGMGMMDDQARNVISFGMQLLDVFFKQLNAKVTVDTTKGTHYQLLFEHTV